MKTVLAFSGLCLYTNNNTSIEIKVNTNTPMNTNTHRNSDTRTNFHTDVINADFHSSTKLKSNTNTNVPANTNHHIVLVPMLILLQNENTSICTNINT